MKKGLGVYTSPPKKYV